MRAWCLTAAYECATLVVRVRKMLNSPRGIFMDYQKHYDRLIERATVRKLDCYTERHHVVPRCLGGSDESENLVDLTPEEHYVAHQLLVKIHPKNGKLIHAAVMMVSCSVAHEGKRKNKLYGWLRRRLSSEAKKRTGSKNGSYGTRWVNDGVKSFKIRKDESLQDGWVEGRIRKVSFCVVCGVPVERKHSKKRKLCDVHLEYHRNSCIEKMRHIKKSSVGWKYITNGIIDRRLMCGDAPPKGFWFGRSNGGLKRG